MKYFFDTEFLEGEQERTWILRGRLGDWILGKPKPTIDLISIGIVSEDGRKYYAISKDFNLKEAWNRYQWKDWISTHGEDNLKQKQYWIRDNVLKPIFVELSDKDGCDGDHFSIKNFNRLLQKYGKTNKQIADEIKTFCGNDGELRNNRSNVKGRYWHQEYPQFYAYYADYDWVAFCWLFGKMIDLPKGFPMYCRDLKQMLDESFSLSSEMIDWVNAEKDVKGKYPSLKLCSHVFHNDRIKEHPSYPEQENEHNALEDARWNKKLYEFLNSL